MDVTECVIQYYTGEWTEPFLLSSNSVPQYPWKRVRHQSWYELRKHELVSIPIKVLANVLEKSRVIS